MADGPMKAGEIDSALGIKESYAKRGRDEAVRRGWLVVETGDKNAKLYRLGPESDKQRISK